MEDLAGINFNYDQCEICQNYKSELVKCCVQFKCSICKKIMLEKFFISGNKKFKSCETCREKAREYKRKCLCEHDIRKDQCSRCCNNPASLWITRCLSRSKQLDKKFKTFESDKFIDREFLEKLLEPLKCSKCFADLQFRETDDSNAPRIGRKNINRGCSKDNVFINCRKCHFSDKSGVEVFYIYPDGSRKGPYYS